MQDFSAGGLLPPWLRQCAGCTPGVPAVG